VPPHELRLKDPGRRCTRYFARNQLIVWETSNFCSIVTSFEPFVARPAA
jgi:hypothetical protein